MLMNPNLQSLSWTVEKAKDVTWKNGYKQESTLRPQRFKGSFLLKLWLLNTYCVPGTWVSSLHGLSI